MLDDDVRRRTSNIRLTYDNLLPRRTLNWRALNVSFASFFVGGLGAIGGSYVAEALSPLVGINGEDAKFALSFVGFLIGFFFSQFYIVPTMVKMLDVGRLTWSSNLVVSLFSRRRCCFFSLKW